MPINIAGIDKAELLAELFNASKQQGLGFLDGRGKAGMTQEEAEEEISTARTNNYRHRIMFDYLRGRVMKVDLTDDDLEPRGFDRDNGHGAAQRVVDSIRAKLASLKA